MSGRHHPVRVLLGRGMLYTLATALQLSSALLALPVITRLIPPREFGLIALALVVQSLLGVLGTLGLADAIARMYFDDDGVTITRGLILATIACAVLTALTAELTAPLWTQVFRVQYGAALRFAVWSSVPVAVIFATQAFLRAAARPGRFLTVAAIATAGAQVLGVVGVEATRSAAGYLGGVTLGLALASSVGLASTGVGVRTVADRAVLRDALAIGVPTLPQSLAFYILWAGDRAIVQRISGLAAAGRYQVAYPIGGLGILIVSALNNAWGPMIYGAREDERWRLLADTAHAVFRFAALLSGALALAAPVALVVVAPASYGRHELGQVSALVAFAAIPYVAYLANLPVLYWQRRTQPLVWIATIAALFNLGLTAVLVHYGGLRGAAVATIASYALQALLLRDSARRLVRVPFGPWIATQALGISGAFVALSLVLPDEGAWLALRGAAAACLLGACGSIALRAKGPTN